MPEEIDARVLACPGPVLETKKALENGADEVVILVGNPTARENVSRFARSRGCDVEAAEAAGGFRVTVRPGAASAVGGDAVPATGTALLVTTDELGRGERELGTRLMKMFLHTCAEGEQPLSCAVFLNSGVRLVTEDDEAAESVRALEARGTEVLVCGTCLDYYGLTDRLQVGHISNMYDIQAALVGASSLLSL